MLQPTKSDPLVSRRAYPASVAAIVEAMPPFAVQIANRWMLGWPKRVKALLADGAYLIVLREQAVYELGVLIESQDLQHLARHEMMQVYEIDPAPPAESVMPCTEPSQAVLDALTTRAELALVLPRDTKGRPYQTRATLDADSRLMLTEDLCQVKVW